MVGSTTWRNGEPCQCPAAASAPSPPPTNNDDPLIGFALKVVYYFGSYQTFHESLADLNLFKEKTESGTNSTGEKTMGLDSSWQIAKEGSFSRLWDDFIAAFSRYFNILVVCCSYLTASWGYTMAWLLGGTLQKMIFIVYAVYIADL